jgi:hypothetical protein
MEDLDTYQIVWLRSDDASETMAEAYISKDVGTGRTTHQTKQTKKLYVGNFRIGE